MERLSRLSAKEASGEQSLSGVYRISMDINISADKEWNISEINKLAETFGNVEDLLVEKYESRNTGEPPFNVGDSIELTEDLSLERSVYIDTAGNLVISDKPVSHCVEKVGDFSVNLSKGTVAEINNKPEKGSAEVLFSGECILIAGLDKPAYLGILELPCKWMARYGD